jgi:hypothetical protein
MQLLTSASESGPLVAWPGGLGLFAVCGQFGGGSVSLQMIGPDGKTPISLMDFAANGAQTFSLPGGSQIQAAIAGASNASIWASATPITPPTIVTDSSGNPVEDSSGDLIFAAG